MGFPFHSFFSGSSRHEGRGGKQNQLFGLLQTAQFVWVGQDTANVLPCHFLENREVFTLEALCPLSCDVQAVPDTGMLRSLCTWGPGLHHGHCVRCRGWVVLGHPVGADSQRRGPPTESPPGSRQHLACSGGLVASTKQASACLGWEI